MRLPGPLLPATMLERVNRFALWAECEGARRYVHVPNSGRLGELLYPGATLLLRPRPPSADRKTTHQVALARFDELWVSVDSRLAPRLCAEFLTAHPRLLGTVRAVRYEVTHGASRLDLQVATSRGEWLIETKSVTLAHAGRGYFPDAPTVRGVKHLRELAALARTGGLAAAVFVVQRPDVTAVSPNAATDPEFAAALGEAREAGVKLIALTCTVTPEAIAAVRAVPVRV